MSEIASADNQWFPMESAPVGIMVQLLYNIQSGDKVVEGVFRSGRFWGKDTQGWWSDYERHPIEQGFNVKTPGMWVDGLIKGWRPLPEARHIERGLLPVKRDSPSPPPVV